MATEAILSELRALGATLAVRGGRLVVRLAGRVPSVALCAAMWAHETDLVEALEPYDGK